MVVYTIVDILGYQMLGNYVLYFGFPVHPEFKSYFSYMSSCIQLRRDLMYLKVAVQYPYQRFHS